MYVAEIDSARQRTETQDSEAGVVGNCDAIARSGWMYRDRYKIDIYSFCECLQGPPVSGVLLE